MGENEARRLEKRVVQAMKFVFDATLLIYFAKMSILDKVIQLKNEKIIPASVYAEVVEKGKKKGKEDAFFVEKLVLEKHFSINSAKPENIEYFMKFKKVRRADAETLAIAKEEMAMAIVDEANLRIIAEMNGIEYAGSIFILFKLYKEKLIKKHDIKKYIDEMIRLGWRCSTELYADVLEEIEKL